MKPEPTEQVETNSANSSAEIADPFAVDLFAAKRTHAAARPDPSVHQTDDFQSPAPARSWHDALPKVSGEEVRRSSAVAALPPSLSDEAHEALARVLARLAQVSPRDISLDSIGLHEASLSEFTSRQSAEHAPRVFASLNVEPEDATLTLALDADFASAIADRLLGGAGAAPDSLRTLSATERALIEFLCLSVVHELNALAGEPLFRVEGVSGTLPSKLAARRGARTENPSQSAAREDDEREARVLVATARVALASTVGLVRIVFDDDALAALSAAGNPLLARARRGGGDGDAGERLAVFRKLAESVPLRLQIGETELGALDLADLEEGDIVIVGRPSVSWDGKINGRLRLLAGAGGGVVIEGSASPSREAVKGESMKEEKADSLVLAVESVSSDGGERDEAERLIMEDEARLETGTEGALALEGLMLTLQVELAARRISLEELSRLRAGQLLELGCRATDPVDLVADGQRVATGELVDIEGRLGVRVTRLLS